MDGTQSTSHSTTQSVQSSSSSDVGAQLWGGRFEGALSPAVASFNNSLPFDGRLYRHDIRGSIAHARMLGAQNIITAEESQQLIQGLTELLSEWEDAFRAGGNPFTGNDAEDIHSAVEQALIERIGTVAKKLHTGRSRNDQVATDLRLYLRDELLTMDELVVSLMNALMEQAGKHLQSMMPGFTHLQPAQPITLAHHLMAYVAMMDRDRSRLADAWRRMNVLPLGSGALATTVYPLDREMVARELSFDGITQNSLDGVSDRDFVLDILHATSVMMAHLSRLSEEVILWASPAFGFVQLDDGYSTGSSMMPQKKNPDVAELIRGKTGRVYGHLVAMLTTMKSLPLAYNKDMQEDKEGLFDALDTVKACLLNGAGMMKTLVFLPDVMANAAGAGFTNATDLADYLVMRGVPFRDAHHYVGQWVRLCLDRGCDLSALSLQDYQSICPQVEEGVYQAIALNTCVAQRNIPGGPAPEMVEQSITHFQTRVTKGLSELHGLQ